MIRNRIDQFLFQLVHIHAVGDGLQEDQAGGPGYWHTETERRKEYVIFSIQERSYYVAFLAPEPEMVQSHEA